MSGKIIDGLFENVVLKGGEFMKKEDETQIEEYKGKKNESHFPDFIKILKMSQFELKLYLRKEMAKYYNEEDIICADGFLYVKGNIPICLTSHMDVTLTTEKGKRVAIIDYYEEEIVDDNGNVFHVLSSPQGIGGDDRCGVWSILNILKETQYRPYIVFCEDEEIGCVGSDKFTKTKLCDELENCKFLVEIDRRGNNDAVFYDDCNEDFHEWIEKTIGYKEEWGSCSDICNLSSACGVSSVNLSSGYYNEHHTYEKIVVEETLRTKNAVIKLIKEGIKDEVEQFIYEEYIAPKGYYRRWYDDWYGYNYEGKVEPEDDIEYLTDGDEAVVGYFVYLDYNNETKEVMVGGNSQAECIANFLMTYGEICWNDVIDYSFEEAA